MLLNQETVMSVLKRVKEPELGRDIVSLDMVRDVVIKGKDLFLTVVLTTPACPLKETIKNEIDREIKSAIPEVGTIEVTWSAEVKSRRIPSANDKRIPGVKNVIAVGSGKGGVGKSTVAVNLALALKSEGASVGILDADIYGPSLPMMFGVKEEEKPKIIGDSRIEPIERYGIKIMSMGFLLPSTEAIIWRGPMLGKMLQQFLEQVEWGALDYLIIDLPPGTGDVQLSLAQLIPLSGAVVVTTPQDVALADVKRAIKMFEVTKVPLLGLVENMSFFECPNCQTHHEIFHRGAADRYEKLGIPLLGEIPLETTTSVSGDEGRPVVVKDPESPQAKRFIDFARQVAAHQSVTNFQEPVELPALH
ncbi:MAG: Mrp/NBP35 family ATP-binding protein [Deltaproteobacteria bacterium]|nr:Mrp/NBP35 family ATP-binding protein [Deltaproteobacteria bacterium]